MITRLLQLPIDENFFLLGPRATGKTTLLKQLPWFKQSFYINLLKPEEERRFTKTPSELEAIVALLPLHITHIIIDEVQKVPKLLDVVHDLIETTEKKFILTGSSARKLKHGGANLLAGRAFVYYLYPFCYLEMHEQFHLNESLRFGTLPKIMEYSTDDKKERYLEAYANTYLKEEIWAEQFIRALSPFRSFLEVAAQSNGKCINFSQIARDVGVDDKTVLKYYAILVDTMLGFFLEAFQHSFRKRLSKMPKFYFFDLGVVSALTGLLSLPLQESTSRYGEAFEHFIILQCLQLNEYYHLGYRFSYLRTKEGVEIDLVIERPGRPLLFMEIKSTEQVEARHVHPLKKIAEDFGTCELVILSRDPYPKQVENIPVYPWADGLQRLFIGDTRT